MGQPRAEAVTKNLLEMNPDVKGAAIVQNPVKLVNEHIETLDKYSLIIVTGNFPWETSLRTLARRCFERKQPLLVARTYGLLGYLRTIVPELTITEVHPDNDRSDLYIHPAQLTLFPQLQTYIDSFLKSPEGKDDVPPPLFSLNDQEYSHVPYPVFLVYAAREWMKTHEGKLPSSWSEKKEFKNSIAQLSRAVKDGAAMEENISEGIANASRVYELPKPSDEVDVVLSDPLASPTYTPSPSTPYTLPLTSSDKFWICVAALNLFRQTHGQATSDIAGVCASGERILLPATGSIPDMTANTSNYLTMQQIYRARAQSDLKVCRGHLSELLTRRGLPADAVSEEELTYVVRNARQLAVLRTRSLEQEINPETFLSDEANQALESLADAFSSEGTEQDASLEAKSPPPVPIQWYFTLRAAERFYTLNGRYPGRKANPSPTEIEFEMSETELAADEEHVSRISREMAEELKINAEGVPPRACAKEIVRVGACEPHTIAAFMGGVAAQEALKLLMKQYAPVPHTFIYDGWYCTAGSFAV